MGPIAILYATREGHTHKIAEHIAATLRGRGLDPEIHDLRDDAEPIVLQRFAGAVLAASVHFGKHEREMVAFVKAHRAEIEGMPAAFLSVNLAEAAVERTNASPRDHAQFVADLDNVIAHFFKETGWHPQRVKAVAGALLYTKYNVLLRFVMKQIAKQSGGDTDTSRDYVYTNWEGLDRFIDEFAKEIPAAAAR